MYRDASIVFLLIAFVNYIIGCAPTYTERSSAEKAAIENEKITQLVLKNGDVIDFDKNGGRITMASEGFDGSIGGGRSLFIPLKQVTEVRLSHASSVPVTELEGVAISEVVLRGGRGILFDQSSGRYNKEQSTIAGNNTRGAKVIFAVKELVSIRTAKPEGVSVASFLSADPRPTVYEVVRDDGMVVVFDSSGATFKETSNVFAGRDVHGQTVQVRKNEVLYATVEKIDPGLSVVMTVGMVAAALGVAFLIALATKESCPFVYSFDGENYVFDGEPYGGAICKGMKRTDWARLDYLKPVNGEYRLLMTNEVDETQFTDEFKLWVVDHKKDEEVLLDANGNAYMVAQRVKPTGAMDNRGGDLTRWLSENDKLHWESDLSLRNPENRSDLRDSIHLTFPKPRDAQDAKFIVSGGTTLWGSEMLKRMVELRGEAIPLWYEKMKSAEERALLDQWNLREELYYLQVRVRVGNEWQTRGWILGGGPFVTEERVVPLNLQGVEGDSVEILVTPAAGFWQLNAFALDFTPNTPVEVQEIDASTITDEDGKDLLNILSATDGHYYAAPSKRQRAKLVFPVPPARQNTKRTLFAKVSGYYEIHMNASGAPKTDILSRIAMEPGYPVSFAIEEYQKWIAELDNVNTTSERGSQ